MRHRLLGALPRFPAEGLRNCGEQVWLAARHTRFFTFSSEWIAQSFIGPDEPAALALMEVEHGNARLALCWSINGANTQLALRLGGAFRRFWFFRSYLAEGRNWLDQVADAGRRRHGAALEGALPVRCRGPGARAGLFLRGAEARFGAARTLAQAGGSEARRERALPSRASGLRPRRERPCTRLAPPGATIRSLVWKRGIRELDPTSTVQPRSGGR